MRIVVDVMGGDHGCGVVIEGVKRALEADGKITEMHLVGKQDEIQAALDSNECRDKRVHVVHASEVLTMEDKPREGMLPLPHRRRRTTVPPSKIGSISQATKNAQAARDARM